MSDTLTLARIYKRPEKAQPVGTVVKMSDPEFPSAFGQVTRLTDETIEISPIGGQSLGGVRLSDVEVGVKENLS